MYCNVCSKETLSSKFETIGNQIVCCLSCVGLLVSNDKDKCDNCQRPVWKDNYYVVDSLNYCSEKCKATAVKRYLKRNNSIRSVNIKHIQNEYFKNESPIKNLQELRKEVKELYEDFEFEENTPVKNTVDISEKKSVVDNLNSIKTIKETEKIEEAIDINDNNIEAPEYNNNQVINVRAVKKCPLIPNKIASIKISDNENCINNYSFYQCPRSQSKKKIMNSYRKLRNNYSFDNPDRVLYGSNNMNIIPKMKYSINDNISIVNDSYKKHLKLKPTILRYQSKDKKIRNKMSKILIPNPNMSNLNETNNLRFNNTKYVDSLENKENEDYDNIPSENYDNYNDNYNRYKKYNSNIFNNNKIYHNSHHNINEDDETNDKKIIYFCDSKYKFIDNSNY